VPQPYQVWLKQSVFDYLDSVDLPERQRLLAWIERLSSQPDREGDFVERGNGGRSWQVALVANHAVVWWVDTPVREVKVVDVRRADR
jgi:hypothetical protein